MKTEYHDSRRVPDELVSKYSSLARENFSPASIICDAQGRANTIGGFFCSGDYKIVGTALTIKLDHDNLVDCIQVLRKAKAGDFVFVSAGGTTATAMWGGMMSNLCKKIGVVGALIDGAVRDLDEIRDLDFAVWYKSTIPRASPTSVHERFDPVAVNVPIAVTDVIVEPGSLVVADECGVSIISYKDAEEVYSAAVKQAAREREVRESILNSTDPVSIIEKYGHI